MKPLQFRVPVSQRRYGQCAEAERVLNYRGSLLLMNDQVRDVSDEGLPEPTGMTCSFTRMLRGLEARDNSQFSFKV